MQFSFFVGSLIRLDGTLLDHDTAERAGAICLHRRIASTEPIEEFLLRWSRGQRNFTQYLKGDITYVNQGRARVRDVVDQILNDAAVDQVFAEYRAVYEGAWSLFPDVLSCLDMLSDHRLGVISNGLAFEQRKLMSTGIADRFEVILISEECGWAKPSPEIFQHACAAVGEEPASVFYIGDRYDLEALAARQAGLAGVWLDRNGKATWQHEPPVITTLNEFAQIYRSCSIG